MAAIRIEEVARRDGRDYITPEDVREALDEGADPGDVQVELLTILAGLTDLRVEDSRTCAWVASVGGR